MQHAALFTCHVMVFRLRSPSTFSISSPEKKRGTTKKKNKSNENGNNDGEEEEEEGVVQVSLIVSDV